jgi:hypothetical protein
MAKKEIDEIRIKPDGEGGHHVTHHFKPIRREGKFGIQEHYQEPESKNFGPGEGHDMLAHVANHLEIPENDERESKETPAYEAKSHPAKFLEAALKDKKRLTHESASKVREAVD